MKSTCVTLLLVVGLAVPALWAASDSGAKGVVSQDAAIRTAVQQALPQLAATAKENPGDVEIRLGTGILSCKYGASPLDWSSGVDGWREILKIDPTNGPAWELLATKEIMIRAARYTQEQEYLERLIANAKKRGAKSVQLEGSVGIQRGGSRKGSSGTRFKVTERPVPQTPSPLYQYFAQSSGRDVFLEDFDAARKILREKLRQELEGAIEMARQAEKADPNNALYNYLLAHALFVLEQNEPAMTEIRRGVQKNCLNTYFVERHRAVSRVLRQVEFPDQLRKEIDDTYAPIGAFIGQNLLRPHIFPLARQYQEQGDAKHAAELYAIVLQVAKQIREEPMPYPSDYNQQAAQYLERQVQERQGSL